ncbi:hypothetical protein MHU86_9670 (mitochondrion) [Fragilaria crotonensis]|nr:hypothetical protein MHU86_9670 [Fragilaria crotonensis]
MRKRRNNVSGSWKKLNWRKTGIEEEGFLSGEATEQDFSDSNREGVLGEGKLSTKNGVLSAKLDENRIVFTKIDKI